MANDAAWYREMGDTYANIAETSTHALTKELNAAEATKYYGIARSIEARSTAGDAE